MKLKIKIETSNSYFHTKDFYWHHIETANMISVNRLKLGLCENRKQKTKIYLVANIAP